MLNEMYKRVAMLDGVWQRDTANADPFEESILGLHEAATKLWLEAKRGSLMSETEKRVANVLIGGLVAAARLGISDVESVMSERLRQLDREKV